MPWVRRTAIDLPLSIGWKITVNEDACTRIGFELR